MRMTQYTYDCLQRKYTAMTLGTVADTLEGNTISARQLPSGIITGSKLAINSVGIGALQSGSVNLTVSTSVQAEIVNVIKGFVMLFATVNLLQYFRGAKKEAAK